MEQTKVAMIREKKENGEFGKLYLNCKCNAKPETSIDTKKDVLCECGKEYTYNGWIK